MGVVRFYSWDPVTVKFVLQFSSFLLSDVRINHVNIASFICWKSTKCSHYFCRFTLNNVEVSWSRLSDIPSKVALYSVVAPFGFYGTLSCFLSFVVSSAPEEGFKGKLKIKFMYLCFVLQMVKDN